MTNLEQLIEEAKQSELFTAPRLQADLRVFLDERAAEIKALAQQALTNGVEHIYFVGSGGSWSNMYSGAYLMDKFTTIPTDALMSYDLIWRDPQRLNENSWVFVASYSGNTEDTVAALRHAKSKGAKTIALISRRESTINSEADLVIDYDSTALYIMPLAAVYIFALELARLQDNSAGDATLAAMDKLPDVLGEAFRKEESRAKELAVQFQDSELLYILGSGALYGLAYKFGPTVFMENIRIHASFIETAEFRHGPVEMLDRMPADMVFLMTNDETRSMSERVLKQAQSREGTRTIVYDAADYDIPPLLAPFVLLVPLQWFVVYAAMLAGITDLDERAYMGHGILAEGGSTWP